MSEAERFWTSLPFGRDVTPLAHDANGLAALLKPAGVLSHPNGPRDEARSLLQAPYEVNGEYFHWRGSAGSEQRLWLLNRLDSATSGVILVASDEALATEIRAHFRRKRVHKVYAALVFGAPRPASDTWRDQLAVEKHGGQIRTVAHAGHVPAECRMTTVKSGGGEPRISLLQLEPRTGRSHQLRVQCARRQCPIVGDQTYGDFPRNRAFAKLAGTKRLFLHSLETRFDYEYRGRRHTFAARAPLPPEFEKFL